MFALLVLWLPGSMNYIRAEVKLDKYGRRGACNKMRVCGLALIVKASMGKLTARLRWQVWHIRSPCLPGSFLWLQEGTQILLDLMDILMLQTCAVGGADIFTRAHKPDPTADPCPAVVHH